MRDCRSQSTRRAPEALSVLHSGKTFCLAAAPTHIPHCTHFTCNRSSDASWPRKAEPCPKGSWSAPACAARATASAMQWDPATERSSRYVTITCTREASSTAPINQSMVLAGGRHRPCGFSGTRITPRKEGDSARSNQASSDWRAFAGRPSRQRGFIPHFALNEPGKSLGCSQATTLPSCASCTGF